MQAIILAAGEGKRLGMNKPKATIEIDGQALIVRMIEQLRDNGVENITVVVGYQADSLIQMTRPLNVDTILNPFYQTSDNLVSFWIGQFRLHDTFIMTHGDMIIKDELLSKLVDSDGDVVLPIDKSSMNEESMKIMLDGSQIAGISKKIPLRIASGESIPIMKFSSQVIPAFSKITEALAEDGNSNRYLEDAIFALVNEKQFQTNLLDVTGIRWMEIDTPEDLEQAKQMFA